MHKNTKGIKRVIAVILTVVLLMNNDYSGFFTVHAQENQGDMLPIVETQADVSGGKVSEETTTEETTTEETATEETATEETATEETGTEEDAPIEVPEDLTISKDYTLSENMVVYNLTISAGTLNLNGYSLTVLKDVKHKGGTLQFNKGVLYCYGNFNVSGSAYVYMTNANDYLYVAQNITWENTDTAYNNLSNGIIEVCGNFTQKSKTSFQPSSYHKIIFSGDEEQIITLNANGSKFNIIEIQNYSDAGVYSPTSFVYNQMIRNGCRLSIGDMEGEYGFDVNEDMTIEGDFILVAETLNLNGHTLTIKGDFIQAGGTVNLNGGNLIVEGDYRIQTRNGEEGAYTYGQSTGILQMQNENDSVLIQGNFYPSSKVNHKDYLTNGVMEVKGDFVQDDTVTSAAFASAENYRVLLSGESKQSMILKSGSNIANLELTNGSEEGVAFGSYVYVTGLLKQNETKVSGSVRVGTDTVFDGNTYIGDVYIAGNKTISEELTINGNVTVAAFVTISGKLTVNGNMSKSGSNTRIDMKGGSLYVSGNLAMSYSTYSYGMNMTNSNDYVYVGGNFSMSCYYEPTLSAGTLEVAGNFNVNNTFHAKGSHKVILSGSAKQSVSLADGAYFATLELQNNSEEGVYSAKALSFTKLIRNGCKLQYGDTEGVYGWTMTADEVVEGDLVLLEDTLDLNGYTLTVKGDFVQAGGTVNINGGNLIVEGDYRMQTRNGEEGAYTYGQSAGILQMQNENDSVLIKGSFYPASKVNHKGYLTNGVMEVKGDFIQEANATSYAFVSTLNHKLVLSGESKQVITTSKTSTIVTLELANGSEEGVAFGPNVYVTGWLKQNGTKVSGSVWIGTGTVFEGNVYTGDVYIAGNKTISEELTINGTVTVAAYVTIVGKLIVNGNLTTSGSDIRIDMKGGSLYVTGNPTISNNIYSHGLNMTNSNDYVYVGGNFSMAYTSEPTFSAGTLEVAGNFSANNIFHAKGSHKVILSGTAKQNVSLADGAYFATLELQNSSEEGVCSSRALSYTELIRNGCRLQYGSTEGSYGFELTEDTAIEGDFILVAETLNLNGYTLTVKGDFIHAGGEVNANGGKLIVDGDYRMQTRNGAEGAYTYGQSTGILRMQNENDSVLIQGSFYPASKVNHKGYLTNGMMEVKGDFIQDDSDTSYAFISAGSYKLVLSGEGKQSITLKNGGTIRNLELVNGSEEGVTLGSYVYVTGLLKQNETKVSGSVRVGTDTVFDGNTYIGDVYIAGNKTISEELTINGNVTVAAFVTISGKLTINGNVSKSGSNTRIDMKGGSLYVSGNLAMSYSTYSYGMNMTNSNDYVYVGGNFSMSCYYEPTLSAGTLEVAGNFSVNNTFHAKGNHKVILSGTAKQNVSLADGAYIATLELQNDSEDGVYSTKALRYAKLIRNGCKLQYGDTEGVYGWTLTEDCVIEGDLVLIEDTLDLNGYTLTVTGDFIHMGAEVRVNGGELNIQGDYRQQFRSGTPGAYTYKTGGGRLIMTNEADRFNVKGDFVIEPGKDMGACFTAGELRIAGDFTQIGTNPFKASGTHALVFSGEAAQTITAATAMAVANLTISNTGSEAVNLNATITASQMVTDNHGKITGSGTVSIATLDKLANNSWSGNLILTGSNTLASDLRIGGRLTTNGKFYVNGYKIYANAVSVGSYFYLQDGIVSCNDGFSVNASGYLIMQNAMGYLLVGGNFSIGSQYSHSGLLTDGVLEVRGDFTQSNVSNFIATGNHTTILSRKRSTTGRAYIQTISFKNAGTAKFNKLVLKKPLTEYQFKNSTSLICNELIYDIEDSTAPTEVGELYASNRGVTDITIAYTAAEDESGVVGYEIYRNDVKIAVTSNLSYRDSGLAPDTEYTYAVYAYDNYRNIARTSPELTVKTMEDTEAPSAVACPTVGTRTGSAITLTWNVPSDNVKTTGYHVYRNDELIAENIAAPTYKDCGLEKNVIYRYSVEALDASGNISERSAVVMSTVAPPAITYVSPDDYSSIGGDKVTLLVRFKNVGNSTGNKIKIEVKADGADWKPITPLLLGQKTYNSNTLYANYVWDISKLAGDKEYVIRYTLYDADNNTDVREVNYLIDKEAPEAVKGLEAIADNGAVRLTWDVSASADCAAYKIYRKNDTDDSFAFIAAVNGKHVDYYTDTDVEEGSTYAYAVTAVDDYANESAMSEAATVTVDADQSAPVVKTMTPYAGKVNATTVITATATDNRNVKQIKFSCKKETEEQWTELATVDALSGKASYHWDTTAYTDGVYYINVVAVDDGGNESMEEYSRRYTIDNTGISKITITGGEAGATDVRLHWEDVTETDFSHFQIEQKQGDAYKKVGTTYDTLGFTINNLIPETTYSFIVVGYDNLDNRGVDSDEFSITTSADTIQPQISAIYPVSSYYRDSLKLQARVRDNNAVGSVVFSYSRDKETFTEIAKVEADTDSSDCTLSKEFDISSLEEGSIFIKFEAYDKAGNKNVLPESGEEILAEYFIDRTAPAKVENIKAVDGDGYVELTWNTPTEKDIDHYRIYRASNEDGIFKLIQENCTTRNYYDTSVTVGGSYIYKLEAVDIAGNVGESSDEIAATVSADDTAPYITGMSPNSKERVGANPVVKALALDNTKLASVKIEYMPADSTDGIWSLIGSTEANDRSCLASFIWKTEGLEEGDYRVRSVATDRYGNVSEAFEVTYTLDLTAPEAPVVEVTNGHFEIGLTMKQDACDDFAYYEIQRKPVGENNWKKIAQTTKQSYTDTRIMVDTVYLYRVAVYDKYGNFAVSAAQEGYADKADVVAPVVSVPENMVGIVGMELAFDGKGSTDNVRITEYKWNMGNGDIIYGSQPRYTYNAAGVYLVRLTVTDEAGNSSCDTINVRIDDKTGKGIAKVRVVNESGQPIPYASVYMEIDKSSHLSLRADSEGYVTIVEAVGLYNVAAYAEGYLPGDIEIVLNEYEDKEYALKLVKDELIVGDLTVHRMTLEEMVEKGIDFSDPANYHTYVFQLTLTFQEMPIPVTIQYICNGSGVNLGGSGNSGGGSSENGSQYTFHDRKLEIKQVLPDEPGEEAVPILAYITTIETVSWLKEMFSVELGILNAADAKYVIEDSVATLNLPEKGVSLAATKSGQTLTQSMGAIAGQERKSASWVVCGDESGSYSLSADFEGRLMPFDAKVGAHFETENDFEVTTGEGIHIYVMPEDSAYIDEEYYIKFKLKNESDHPFYNLRTSFGASPAKTLTIAGPGKVNQSIVMDENHALRVAVLNPGEECYGIYRTVFSAETESNPEDVYYELISWLTETLAGENLGVKVTVIPMSGHISKTKTVVEEIPTYFGDPIDITSGHFSEELTPLSVTGVTPLTFDMNYSSGVTDTAGQMGYGWYHDYELRVAENQGLITFYVNPSSGVLFIKEGLFGSESGNEFALAEGEEYSYGEYTGLSSVYKDCRLTKNTDGTYTVTMPNAGRYEFDAQGRLTAIVDAEGQSVTLSYHDGVTTVTENASGKHLYLNYGDGTRITSVSDDAGRKAAFTYDGAGNLATLTDPAGYVLTYHYDDKHRILSEGNEQGIYVSNVYDDEGRVIRQTDALGNAMTAAYEETEDGMSVSFTDAAGRVNKATVNHKGELTGVTDKEGRTTEYQYTAAGRLVCEKDAYGKAIYREYDSHGNMVKLTDKGGVTTVMTYDEKGNVESITNAKGKKATYTYNEKNLKTSETDFNGLTTTYEYNASGQVTKQTTEGIGSVVYEYENGFISSVKDYLGNVTTSRYDAAGNLIEQTDALGNTTRYEYDNLARVTKMTDALGNIRTYSYDCNGNLIEETDALGNRYSYQYDRAGNRIRENYPDGTATEYGYDGDGNCTKVKFADGTENTYTYDGSGNLVKEKLSDGTAMTYTYDKLNQRILETDKDGRKVSYAYYPNGNLYKTTYPDGTYELYTYDQSWKVISVADQSGHTVSYEYDAMGNQTLKRDALGNTWRYEYDALGRLTKETDANGNSTTYAYDANSNCIRKTNAAGAAVHMTYDALNRMTDAYMTDSEGVEYRVSYTYDALGRVLTGTDEEGNTTRMTYDAAGNLLSLTDALGVVTDVRTYDGMGRCTSVTDALGVTTDYGYDVTGNLIQAVKTLNGGNAVTAYGYDALGRMTSVTDANKGVTSVTYDGRGNIVTRKDANGGTTGYTYDDMDRLIMEVSPMGSRTAYAYNAEGLLSEVENARGQKTAYTYDAAGRITSMTDELGTVSYTYDANGNVLTTEDESGTITRKYDSLNRVTEYTDCRGNTVRYSYDELGNLIALTYPGGEIVRYGYYKNGHIKSVTDTEGLVTTYEYDALGSMTRCERPNGTTELCTYDAAGMLITQKDVKTAAGAADAESAAAEEIITEFIYTYDERGNITSIDSSETTDINENITGLKSARMTYDADNRLVSYNGEEVRYDADGNMTYGPVDGVMSELVYDCRNRLVSAGGVRYTYDAENNRTAVETDAYVEEYVVDTVSASLSRVLVTSRTKKNDATEETTGTADVTLYIYGNGLISEYQGDLVLYHHYNNLGSTMKLTDASGNVTASYTYGAYGELLSGDTSMTRFLYNGRCGVATDDNGLYYMRQRYYNTEIKRFINQDVIRGSIDNSQSLNRYSYVQGNPISYTDPFGLSPTNGLFTGTGFTHALLGVLGCVPGPVGIIANVVDAAIYAFVDHDYAMAALAVLSAATMGAASIAKAAKAGSTLGKTAKAVGTACSAISNGASFLMNGEMALTNMKGMYEKYVVRGQAFDESTEFELLQLGMNFFGCAASGKALAKDAKTLAKLMQEERVASKLTESFKKFGNTVKTNTKALVQDNSGSVDFSAFGGKGGTTSVDLYSFGNKSEPRGARAKQDFGVDDFDDIVGPEAPPLPKGASNVTDVNNAPLTGNYHLLPAGTKMPEGIDVIADGIDVIAGSPHCKGHCTIFPTREMTVNEFNKLYKSLPWIYGGKK